MIAQHYVQSTLSLCLKMTAAEVAGSSHSDVPVLPKQSQNSLCISILHAVIEDKLCKILFVSFINFCPLSSASPFDLLLPILHQQSPSLYFNAPYRPTQSVTMKDAERLKD